MAITGLKVFVLIDAAVEDYGLKVSVSYPAGLSLNLGSHMWEQGHGQMPSYFLAKLRKEGAKKKSHQKPPIS